MTTHEDGLCSGCGHPRDRSWNEDMAGLYEPHTGLCQACQAVHAHIEEHGGHLRAGETVYVTDTAPDGFEPDPRMMSGG